MKIAVFSDSHGERENMLTAIEDFAPDCVIHLGDCTDDAEFIAQRYPQLPLHSVRGNCDVGSSAPESKLIELDGVKIFLAHGHRYGVKMGMDSFLNSVYFSGASLGLFGHTHQPFSAQYAGVRLFNPGTCGKIHSPTYGQITIENCCTCCKIVEIYR